MVLEAFRDASGVSEEFVGVSAGVKGVSKSFTMLQTSFGAGAGSKGVTRNYIVFRTV